MPRISMIQLRNGTAADWAAANPVLGDGEVGLETDTLRSKFGDGATSWNSLAYATIPLAETNSLISTAFANVGPSNLITAAFRRVRVVVAGDSITQSSSSTTGGGNIFWGDGYAPHSIYKAGPRFVLTYNAGIAGNTSTQLLARFQTDVMAKKPDMVMIMIGTNDISSGGSTSQITTLMNNIQSMVTTALAGGVLPVIVTPPAKDSAKPEMRRAIPYFYRLAEAYDLPLIDMFFITVDPATGGWKSGYSDDGTHPNWTGIKAMSDYAGPILKALSSYQPRPYLAAYSETTTGQPANLIRNGSFAQQGTPGTPDGWTVNLTNATRDATNDAVAPWAGKEFRYVKTVAGGAYALSGSSAGWAEGDKVRFSGSIDVSTLTSSALGFNVALDASGKGVRALSASKQNGSLDFCVTMTVETGGTSLVPSLYVNDAGTYKVRNLTAINLTQMDLVWTPSNGRGI